MSRLLETFASHLVRHPWVVIAMLTALVIAVGHRAPFIQQDNSPDTFFSADEQARDTYREMIDVFGADEIVLVELRGARADRAEDLLAVRNLADDLAKAPGVKQVFSPMQAEPGDDEFEPEPPTPEHVALVQKELQSVALYRTLGVYRPDVPSIGAAAAVVMHGPESRPRLAEAVRALESKYRAMGYEPTAAGLALANAAIDRETQRSLGIYMPLVGIVGLLVGWLVFRSPRAIVGLALPAGGVLLMGVGGLELAGETINLVSGVMPPLVLAVSFAGAIHMVAHYANGLSDGLEPLRAVERTVREKLVPTALAFGTTAVGFGSLALSDVRAVRVLGAATGLSLLAALLFVALGTPALLALLRPRIAAPSHRHAVLARLAAFSLRNRLALVALGALAIAGASVGVTRLQSNINGMDLLADDVPERVHYQRLEDEGLGLANVDIWIKKPVPDDDALLADAAKVQQMANELRKAPMVTGVVGIHDVLLLLGYRMSGHAMIPGTLGPLETMTEEARQRMRDEFRLYAHPERGLKLTVLTRTGDEAVVREQHRRIREAAATAFPDAPIEISGHFTMLIGTPGTLTRTLLQSLAVSVGVVALLFLVAFRSPRLVAAGMIANLTPVVVALGAMGWLDVPLDVATVMTASVAFGIAVDDTFHYLHHHSATGSIVEAAKIAGQGVVGTTLVIGCGFAVLALSGFNPVVRFGVITAGAMGVALIVDALLLPALVGRARAVP